MLCKGKVNGSQRFVNALGVRGFIQGETAVSLSIASCMHGFATFRMVPVHRLVERRYSQSNLRNLWVGACGLSG
jgi:hypothetical protein